MRFNTPPVVKNLIIINILFFMAEMLLPHGNGDRLVEMLALHFWESPNFGVYQIVTHMFLHANFTHLFFNMFALWMFGRILEYDLGSKRFLIFFMVSGMGAALIHLGMEWYDIGRIQAAAAEVINTPTPELFDQFITTYFSGYKGAGMDPFIESWAANPENVSYINEAHNIIQSLIAKRIGIPTIGASGAVFGILLAFGMLHPNDRIMLLIPPIPMKAKYFVILYGLLELFLGFNQRGSNIAHFAHVGGMLWGFMLLYLWKKQGKIYY